MLKLIVTIVCDICGDTFEPVAVSCDRNPSAWRFLARELEASAEGSGWNLYGSCLCPGCCPEIPDATTNYATADQGDEF